jgi:predicted permease
MGTLFDFRLAARTLRGNPGFTLTATAALALGIGANAAIFSLVDQALLHPAGVARPDRVVAVRVRYDKLNLRSIPLSAPDFRDVRDSREVFEHTAVVDQGDFNYTGGDLPERLRGAAVSREYFDVFGARPMLGRSFSAEEDRPGANQAVVLAYAAWKRLFGGDAGVLGRTIPLNQKPYRVVGVMGPEFRWPSGVDLWAPLGLAPDAYAEDNRFNEHLYAVARLRDGVPFGRAAAFAGVLSDRVRNARGRGANYARDSAWGMFLVPFTDFVAGDTRTPMLVLLGAVGFVLLIACSNIAGLMVARASGRAREAAVRIALGASRWQLIRQTMAESLLLAAGGAAAGLAAGYAGVRLLLAVAPEGAAAGFVARLDVRVLLFTTTVAVVSAILFGLAPAWQISRMDPQAGLQAAGRSGMGGRARTRLRSALVVAETALALVLLAGAGLLLRSLARLQEVNPGFDPRGVITATLSLPPAAYPDEPKRIAFYQAVVDRLAAVPGVSAAATILPLPFSGFDASASFQIEEKPTAPGDPGPHGDVRAVSPAYFRAMGIPLKRGRFFSDQDRQGTERVAIVDENLARQYWPGEDPIAQHIRNGSQGAWATVVGVVGHVHHSALATDTGKGVYYYPIWQRAAPVSSFVVKTEGDPARFAAAIREAVRAIDPAQPVHDVRTMAAMVEDSLAPRRFVVRLMGFFAAAALLLAALGLYGVISYSVAQRTQEIGVRMALGAPAGSVLALILGHGFRLAAAGVAAGLIVSVIAAQWVRSQLYRVSAFDPLTFAATALVLIAAALLASYIPARRATKVDPSTALRWE